MMHATTVRLYQAAAQLCHIHDAAQLALTLAVSHQTLRNWEQKGLSKKGFQKAQHILGVSAQWLETGQGNILAGQPEASLSVGTNNKKAEWDGQQFALQRLGLDGAHIISQMVNNDNMFPTLSVGDTVLIDTAIDAYIGSGIYAIDSPSGQMIYRMNTFQNGFLMLIHDNLAYPPEILRPEALNHLVIIGRVVGKYGVMAL